MPRYFFHVADGENSPDPEGTDLADFEAFAVRVVPRDVNNEGRAPLRFRFAIITGSSILLWLAMIATISWMVQ